MFVVTNNEQKNWSKKLKLLFVVTNNLQKEDSVITFEGTKNKHVFTVDNNEQTYNFFFCKK